MLFPDLLQQEKTSTMRENIELYPIWIFLPDEEQRLQNFTQDQTTQLL